MSPNRSRKGKIKGEKGHSSRGSISSKPFSSRDGIDSSQSSSNSTPHRSFAAGKSDVPSQSSTLDRFDIAEYDMTRDLNTFSRRFRATASVMYESALTEAASLGHAGNKVSDESPSRKLSSREHTSPKGKINSGSRDSVLGELGDFF